MTRVINDDGGTAAAANFFVQISLPDYNSAINMIGNENGNNATGWDRTLVDEGTKVLRGSWRNTGSAASPVWVWTLEGSPSRTNPADFVRYTDPNGNLARVILDGRGLPYNPTVAQNMTTSCSQCPGGAPRAWSVSAGGLFTGLLDVNDVDYNSFDLAYTTGCTWTYPVDALGVSATLEFTSTWVLTISGLVSPPLVYTLSSADWSCTGDNIMEGSSNPDDAPPYMYLSPQAGAQNQPGKVLIQKYSEANFYLLGIPTVIGP